MPQDPRDPSDAQLVGQACGRAAQVLGLSPEELSKLLSQHQPGADGINQEPKPREGQPAVLFLRVYRIGSSSPTVTLATCQMSIRLTSGVNLVDR